jgi:hypothetical protein
VQQQRLQCSIQRAFTQILKQHLKHFDTHMPHRVNNLAELPQGTACGLPHKGSSFHI